MIGRTFDHYRIEAKLGEGGMGVVYKAHDAHLDRVVAIKFLSPDRVADPDRKQRFFQEARAASALNHPNIVTIHDIRSDTGIDFIVMEYVEGKTLDDLLPPHGLPARRALHYAVQIADALAKAHAAGILHRDLKPSNVMVTNDGRLKILDFGLAKLLEADRLAGLTTRTAPLTVVGSVIGTPDYMSPEQAEGRTLDARSDIFSLGSVLYEMVTGSKPFTSHSTVSILGKILSEDPRPPRELTESIPPDLAKLILRCLRKDPARRYQTMADLKVAMQDIEAELAPTSGAKRAVGPSVWAWVVVLPVLLGGYLGWRAWFGRPSVEPLQAVALTTFPGVELYPSISPDGNHVAFMWTGPNQENRDIWLQQIGAGPPLRLTTDPRSDFNPVWSPDGHWIAFVRGESAGNLVQGNREVRLIRPLGGPERKLVEIRVGEPYFNPVYLTWCPDSTCLVVTDSPVEGKPDALFVVSIETGEKRRLTDPQPPLMGDSNPAVSPDGHSLVFRRITGWGASDLYWLPLGRGLTVAGQPRRLAHATAGAEYPAWLPDGTEILFSARGSLWRLAVSGQSPAARLPFVGEDGRMPVISARQSGRPSRLVYVRSLADSNIWRVETPASGVPSASPPFVAISSTRWDLNPQFSPDGNRVAFESTRSGGWEVWLADPDGSNPVQLTSMGVGISGTPRWSHDGQLIAFDSNSAGQFGDLCDPRRRRQTSPPYIASGQ